MKDFVDSQEAALWIEDCLSFLTNKNYIEMANRYVHIAMIEHIRKDHSSSGSSLLFGSQTWPRVFSMASHHLPKPVPKPLINGELGEACGEDRTLWVSSDSQEGAMGGHVDAWASI